MPVGYETKMMEPALVTIFPRPASTLITAIRTFFTTTSVGRLGSRPAPSYCARTAAHVSRSAAPALLQTVRRFSERRRRFSSSVIQPPPFGTNPAALGACKKGGAARRLTRNVGSLLLVPAN